MNFYKRFIGDYARKTGHLSICEHGAYALMLDAHYGTGKPLPPDPSRVFRLIRANTEEEQQAVQTILDQFWELTDEGWVNKRALEEIEKAAIQAEKNLIIALAREAKKRSIRDKHEQSTKRSTNRDTKRSTNVQPIHSHSHSQIPDTRAKTKEKEKEGSSELPAADALMLLPTNKTELCYTVTLGKRNEYQESYPGIRCRSAAPKGKAMANRQPHAPKDTQRYANLPESLDGQRSG